MVEIGPSTAYSTIPLNTPSADGPNTGTDNTTSGAQTSSNRTPTPEELQQAERLRESLMTFSSSAEKFANMVEEKGVSGVDANTWFSTDATLKSLEQLTSSAVGFDTTAFMKVIRETQQTMKNAHMANRRDDMNAQAQAISASADQMKAANDLRLWANLTKAVATIGQGLIAMGQAGVQLVGAGVAAKEAIADAKVPKAESLDIELPEIGEKMPDAKVPDVKTSNVDITLSRTKGLADGVGAVNTAVGGVADVVVAGLNHAAGLADEQVKRLDAQAQRLATQAQDEKDLADKNNEAIGDMKQAVRDANAAESDLSKTLSRNI